MNIVGPVGGGEILQYWGNNGPANSGINKSLLLQYLYGVPLARLAICLLLVVLAVIFIQKVLDIKWKKKGKGLINEINYMQQLKAYDARVMQANKYMSRITKFVEMTPFRLSKRKEEYWDYNLNRANILIPGKYRVMRAKEFNALQVFGIAIACLGGVLISLVSLSGGAMVILLALVCGTVFPMRVVRSIIQKKDDEIIANFADFYLMIHYVLIAHSTTPLEGVMKSYQKTTDNEEMKRFVDVCIHYIEVYGEYGATRYIAKDYRELAQVAKLCRLIRQANSGGDIDIELMAFRTELINAKRYKLEKKMDKLVAKGKAQFNILMIILVQAVISAMSIYFEDIAGMGSWFG